MPFITRKLDLTRTGGVLTYTVPNKFMKSSYGERLRGHLVSEKAISTVLDFGNYQVFDRLSTYTCIPSVSEGGSNSATFGEVASARLREVETSEVSYDDISEST